MSQQYPPPPSGSYNGPPDPQQWQNYGQPPPAPAPAAAPKKRRKWPWIVGAIVLLLIIVSNTGNKSTSVPQTPTSLPTQAGAPQAAAPAAPAQPADDAPAAASGPLTSFSDGTYEVGTGDGQVAPGKYKSPGDGGTCYWARLKHNDGELGDIVANNLGQGQMILNVKKGDGYVEIRGCEFTKVG